jgi:hypothetical protein
MFFWVILFILTFLGSIALVFYLTIELNELEKAVKGISDIVRKRYAPDDK